MPPAFVAPTEEHLLTCDLCRDRIRKLNEYFSVMREALVHILAGEAVFMRTENNYDGWKSVKWR